MDLVLVDIADQIATVTMNRPEARNALSSALLSELRATLQRLDANDEVGVVILTGADPAFSAGLDLKELGSSEGKLLATGGVVDAEVRSKKSRGAETAVQSEPAVADETKPWDPLHKPLIAAVNGVAVTGGFELMLLCDFAIASERARFGDTHARVGILPGWGLSALLPQYIGVRRAIEMSLTGNFIDADEAYQLGLVNHVVQHDELLPFTRRLAADIIGNNSGAVRALLASYKAISRMTLADGFAHETKVSRAWAASDFSPDAVAERRSAIMKRGRTMV